MRKWSFLTNHATVFGQIARQPGSTFRQIASASGVSCRALHKAIGDLEKDGYIIRKREDREFRYSANPELRLHRDIERGNSLEDFCSLWGEKRSALDR